MDENKGKISLDKMLIYQIKVPGMLGEQWTDWYEGITVTYGVEERQSITILTVSSDQASLQSLLRRLYSMGIPLISVKSLEKSEISEGENTMKKSLKRPVMVWPLVIVLVLLSMGGFSGGIPMLSDPINGGYLQFAELLPLLPVSNLILPGLFVLVVMGIYPLLLAFALVARPTWDWVDRLFKWSKHHWAWTGTLILVAIIAIWLVYEGWLVGWFPITYITAVLGLLILLFATLPSVRKFFIR